MTKKLITDSITFDQIANADYLEVTMKYTHPIILTYLSQYKIKSGTMYSKSRSNHNEKNETLISKGWEKMSKKDTENVLSLFNEILSSPTLKDGQKSFADGKFTFYLYTKNTIKSHSIKAPIKKSSMKFLENSVRKMF